MYNRPQTSRRAGSILLLGVLLISTTLHAQTTVTVRVMAANLTGASQKYGDPEIRIFQGLKPDIVCIQEFNYSNNTPADIRIMVDTAFGPDFGYYREPFTGGGDIPNGVISRFPLVNSGYWPDTEVGNRGFAWAQIAVPGTNNLYVVSVHLLTSSSSARGTEAAHLKTLIQSNFPPGAWIIVAGDFNTDSRTESPAMPTFTSYLSDYPIPADNNGNSDTSMNRNSPHDFVLPSFSLTNRLVATVYPSHTFPNGLVFDSRVYTPLTDAPPVLVGDSVGAQHMGVLKDFSIPVPDTGTSNAPSIATQPQSQTVALGANASFSVTTSGTAPLAYQWRFYATNLAGATTSAFTRTNAQPADAGDYSVVVTNSYGSVTSSVVTLAVSPAPGITNQPQSLSVSLGQSATFSVGAGGLLPLSYQWRFFGTNLPGAVGASFNRAAAQFADAGNYTVVVTNSSGSVTSSVATLSVSPESSGAIIAEWNFNSVVADTNTATGATTPSIGSGTAALVGGVTSAFVTGDTALDPAGTTDNSGLNTTVYPAQGSGNKTRGVQFNVSTVSKQNIAVSWSSQSSNTGSKYGRLQYSTNGTDFGDFAVAFVNGTSFTGKTNSLAGISAVNDNPNFAFRLVSEFESTAIGTTNANYVAAGTAYGTAGTMRYDMVRVWGTALSGSNPPAQAPVLTAPSMSNGLFQFRLTGSAGSNYVVQVATNLTGSNWTSLLTNASPCTFTEATPAFVPQRFYRAIVAP